MENKIEKILLKYGYNKITLDEAKQELLNLHLVSYSVAQQYAEFCVRCDREKLPLIKIEDYIKQYCC